MAAGIMVMGSSLGVGAQAQIAPARPSYVQSLKDLLVMGITRAADAWVSIGPDQGLLPWL